jgi:8-oxo-dGTP diphosphatase
MIPIVDEEVSSEDRRWRDRFPSLYRAQPFGWGGTGDSRLQIQFSRQIPPDELISNVKVIGRCDGGVVVFETEQGWRNVPGGTREPGETLTEAADRELYEEVGARLKGPLEWIGAFRVDHSVAGPYRPHLPFPISYWAYTAADIELVAEPTNPDDGEQVTAVQVLPIDEAIEFLSVFDDGPLLDAVKLAHALELDAPDGAR